MSHSVASPADLARPAGAVASTAPRPGVVVAVLSFSGIVVASMQSLVIPLLPELPRLVHASASGAVWAITATLLASAVATPVAGRLGDMYGKRRMLLASLGLLVVGSAVAGLSTTLIPLVVGRTLQGLSAGVIPLGISIMRDELPPERLGSATATMSSSLGVGGAVGLPTAALIADHASWHLLFWVSAGLGVLATALVLWLVPESRARTGGRVDLVGAVGLSTVLVCLLLAISQGADWGWGSGRTLGLAVAGVAVLLVWGRWELRARQPLVDLRTSARRQVLVTNLASIMFGVATMPVRLVQPQILQLPTATGYGLGKSLLVTGLVLTPTGLVMMVVSPLSARISAARGPKTTLMAGAVLIAAGYGLGIGLMSAIWQLMMVTTVIGAGIGLAYGAMPALIMAAVPISETGAANSLNSLMRTVGAAIASAVGGAVLAGITITVAGVTVPGQNGLRVAMVIGGAAALLALAITTFVPRRRPLAPSDA
ncbi:MFS transporter [Parafrankia discariae]|uniref:MFS transporter n=1 Tax=Parafrankia discariae TaxID=365528 RepID=UPI0003A59218|nr:MFS transporter [Parafrankia discariae]